MYDIESTWCKIRRRGRNPFNFVSHSAGTTTGNDCSWKENNTDPSDASKVTAAQEVHPWLEFKGGTWTKLARPEGGPAVNSSRDGVPTETHTLDHCL
jgi:hypothetical protein